MFFSVRDLELRKAQFDVSIEQGIVDFSDAKLRQIGPLEARGSVEFVPHSVGDLQMAGTLQGRMEADCDRCLDPARFDVEVSLGILFKPATEDADEEEVELEEGETEVAFYDRDGVLLENVLREQIVLALPIKLVCKPDCLGLCPVCGENWNHRECACERKPVDLRWSALKDL